MHPELTKNEKRKPVTAETLEAFKAWVDNMIAEYMAAHLPNLPVETIEFEKGRKNIRIVSNRSAWAFIEIATGKIMKAASFKSPDQKRYERGNVNDPDSWSKWLTPYGPQGIR